MFGGTNVQASAPEARDALERGTADEITFPWGSIFLFGIDKAVKYHMDVPLYTTVFTYNMNLDKYNSMSDAQKKVIDDHCTPEWASKVTDPWTEFEANGRVKMKALAGPRGLPVDAGAARAMEGGGEAAARQLGRGGQEGRRRSGRDRRRPAGRAEEVRRGTLRLSVEAKARVMPGLVRACTSLDSDRREDVDGRDEPGHDEIRVGTGQP